MNTQISSSRDKTRSAFTLIEIMVATVVMVVLTGLVIQITSEVLKVWNRSSGKLAANAEARITIDLLAQDLESAVLDNGGLQWMEAIQENVDGPLDGGDFKTTRLLLFAAAIDRPTKDANKDIIPGDICAISYQLMYQDPVDGLDSPLDNAFALHRRIIDSKTTFEILLGEGNQNDFSKWNGTTPSSVVPSSVPRKDNINVYPYTGDPENYLSSNIVDFRVDFYVEDDGNPNTKTLVSSYGGVDTIYGGDNATVGPQSSGDNALKKQLAYAEITLVIISDEALQVIQNDAWAQTGYETDEGYISANSEVYTRRVNFLARPL